MKPIGGYYATFEFKNNLYSTYYQGTHFTPVWFPTGTYQVYVKTIDAWTPACMMSVNLTDTLSISDRM
ncbi:MAG: hypothetical protein R3Y54_08130 [Eubacteriales bacterium]